MIPKNNVKISENIVGVDKIVVRSNSKDGLYNIYTNGDIADINLFINNSGTHIAIKDREGNIAFFANASFVIYGTDDSPLLNSLFTMETSEANELQTRTLKSLARD